MTFSSIHSRLTTFLRTSAGIIAVNLLLVLFVTLGVQFIAKVYAFSFTLNHTDTETGDDQSVILMDYDNDGDLDYVVLNVDAMSIFDFERHTNDGTGLFTSGSTFGDSLGAGAGVAGDIDGDGDVDIVHIGNYGQSIYKQVNDGTGTFTAHTIINGISSSLNRILLVDVDNDGDLDILMISNLAESQGLMLNNGHGVFTRVNSSFPGVRDAAAADVDGDGFLDLILLTTGGIRTYRNSGTGAFVQVANIAGLTSMSVIAVGDVDNDGDIDIAVSDPTTGGVADLVIARNDGTGTFTPDSAFSSNLYIIRALSLVDIDNDGNLDLLATSRLNVGNGGTTIFLGNGAGNFSNYTSFGSSDNAYAAAIGDIDNDGDLDIIHGNYGANKSYKNNASLTVANTAPGAPSSLTGATIGKTPQNGTTFVNDNSIGTAPWSLPTNAAAEDGSFSNAGSMSTGQISNYLKATGFGHTIPGDATILGIKVDVKKRFASTLVINDYAVRLVKGGTIQSTDRSDGANWPEIEAYTSYGGPTDLWGTTWTPTEVNAANFGFAIAAIGGAGTGGGASVDHIRITVYYSAADVRLSWGSGSDTHTPTKLLQYQLRVGTGSSAHNIVSSRTASTNWIHRMLPNNQSRTMLLRNLRCRDDLTYYWTVSTVDTGLKTTAATEQTFTLDDDCGLAFGGGGGGPPPPPPAGGGLSARYFRTNSGEGSGAAGNGLITVTGFNDLDGNGVKSERELGGFKGLPLTASGRTADDVAVRRTLSLGEGGTIIFDLPASDDRGYWISFETGSSVIQGFEATGRTSSGGYVLRSGGKATVNFGFRRADLLRYAPCLRVGTPAATEVPGSDAQLLMQRLEDVFGQKATHGIDTTEGLISRREFFTLLQRTQCIDHIRDRDILETKLRESGKRLKFSLPLIDLPIDLRKADALLMYSLIAAGADVGRATSIGDAADLRSPITREEAVRAVQTVLMIPENKKPSSGVLPKDMEKDDALAPDFLALQHLGVLPESFQPNFGHSQGLNGTETALMLARAAFRGGKIFLLPEAVNIKELRKAANLPTFLGILPALKPLACLEKNTERGMNISFSDILPGDTVYGDLRDLLSYGTKNSAGQTLWLFAATRRPTEFGILRGQTKSGLEEPVSLLETVRDLLILGCLPPDTAIDVLSGKAKAWVSQGSGESRTARDRISGLPRDSSFASRVLFRAQDHQKEFDLSLFTYAPNMLRKEIRSPGSGLNLEEASSVLASGLLMIHVKAKTMSPQEAEEFMEPLKAAITKDLVGKDIDWRNAAVLDVTPFTRRMLLRFLATVVSGRVSVSSVAPPPVVPLGEAWWERIR